MSYNLYEKKTAGIISELFVKLAQAYKPFWGCISNRALSRKYGKFLEGNLPTIIHWMNYWSEDIICAIGMEKIRNVVDKNTTISFKCGILSIKETALDVENEEDLRFHDELQEHLFL